MGFMKIFFSGIVKRKAAKGMENIYKDNPRLAKAAKAAHDANERLTRALEIRLHLHKASDSAQIINPYSNPYKSASDLEFHPTRAVQIGCKWVTRFDKGAIYEFKNSEDKERLIEAKDFVDLNTPEAKLYYSKWLEKKLSVYEKLSITH